MEQPQYNLFHRKRVEQEYARLYADIGLGLTTWSPLASGLLTGKYRGGVPADSRGAIESMGFLVKGLTDAGRNGAVAKLEAIAADLGCSVAQLAIAWCAKNPRVSTRDHRAPRSCPSCATTCARSTCCRSSTPP